jgi:hypothetical protein
MIFSKKMSGLKDQIPAPALAHLPEDVVIISADDPVPDKTDPTKIIAIGPGLSTEAALDYLVKSGVRHLLPGDSPDLTLQLQCTAELIAAPSNFIKNPGQMILRTETEHHGVRIKVKGSKDRQFIHSSIEGFIETIPAYMTIKDSLLVIADELVTNAVFNAPTDDVLQKHKFAHRSRKEDIRLEAGFSAELFIIVHESQLLIGCHDHYGSLDCLPFLKRLQNSYSGQQSVQVDMNAGGAGIGSRMVLDHCSSFFAVVREKKDTVICCVLPLHTRMRKIETMSKSLHFVTFKESSAK